MSRTLYLVSTSRLLNPLLSAEREAEDYASDPDSAGADWGGLFRSTSVQAYADDDIDVAVMRAVHAIPSDRNQDYVAFADLSGGRHDGAALAVAHRDNTKVVVDRVEIIPAPHDPKKAIARIAEVCREYWVNSVTADNYGAELIVSEFAANGISLSRSELSASDIYCQAMPLFTARILCIPEIPQLINEIRQLERRPRAGGGERFNHPRNGMDDAANATLGAAVKASTRKWSGRIPDSPKRGQHINGLDYDPWTRDEQQHRDSAAMPAHDGWGRPI